MKLVDLRKELPEIERFVKETGLEIAPSFILELCEIIVYYYSKIDEMNQEKIYKPHINIYNIWLFRNRKLNFAYILTRYKLENKQDFLDLFDKYREIAGKVKEKRNEQSKAYNQANKKKINEQSKAWYEANKERVKAYKKANKEKIKEQMKAYHQVNKEKRNEQMKAYHRVNKEKRNEQARVRRQKKKLEKQQEAKECKS